MAIRHSPGPWTLTDRTIIAANGENVGGCVVKRMKDGDALLIAAAPDMLATLDKIATYCQAQVFADTGEALIWAQCESFARVALAKVGK